MQESSLFTFVNCSNQLHFSVSLTSSYVYELFLFLFYAIKNSDDFVRGKETEFHIEPELTLELMMAANYLHT